MEKYSKLKFVLLQIKKRMGTEQFKDATMCQSLFTLDRGFMFKPRKLDPKSTASKHFQLKYL